MKKVAKNREEPRINTVTSEEKRSTVDRSSMKSRKSLSHRKWNAIRPTGKTDGKAIKERTDQPVQEDTIINRVSDFRKSNSGCLQQYSNTNQHMHLC